MEHISDVSEPATEKKLTTSAKFLITATGGVAVGLSVICASFIAPAFRRICLPYVPATTQQLTNVLSFLPKNSTKSNGKLLDIGSGDGRVVIAAAQQKGINKADGVELNFWLVLYSRLAAMRYGVKNKTKFFCADLWKFNISSYNYFVIFGVEQMMNDLEQKLLKEASPDAKIIACRYPLPNLRPIQTLEYGVDSVWYYHLKNSMK